MITNGSKMRLKEIEALSDQELEYLNELLPWASFIEDSRGRRFGRAYSEKKRNKPQSIPDRRITLLNHRYDLSDKSVLELGCFEGNHTVALAGFAKKVIGVDARIENVIKTLVRLWACGLEKNSDLFLWNVEKEPEDASRLECDILHHVGVLYHLMDPVCHLDFLLPRVRKAVMLDTHVATRENATKRYESEGRIFCYRESGEPGGREVPFSGIYDHAKWLLEEDLEKILKENGFSKVEVEERRDERNGLRVLIFAER